MTNFDFTVMKRTGVDVITFGNAEKTVTIDVTFIPSAIGFQMKSMLTKDKDTDRYAPESLAEMIALFTNDVDAQWIVENTDYGTLDQIVAILINKAFGRKPEKN